MLIRVRKENAAMEHPNATAHRPDIRMIDAESERLSALALSASACHPAVADLLLAEIERARLVRAADMPRDVVTMGAEVEFLDRRSGEQRAVRLVWPTEADIDAGRVSVLTPVGAGLIGLSEGQSIDWPDREGRPRTLSVLRVRQAAN